LAHGARDFGVGIYKGVTGIVTEPIKGVRKEGAVGLAKGLGRGLIGVVLKPTIGTIDLITQTAEGIKNTTTVLDNQRKIRVRPPRHFGSDGLLRLYNVDKAIGQEFLVTANKGKLKNQFYVYHINLPDKEILMVSEMLVLLLVETSPISFKGRGWESKWQMKRKGITQFEFRETSVTLVEQRERESQGKTGPRRHSFIIAVTAEKAGKKAKKLFNVLNLPNTALVTTPKKRSPL